MAKKRRKHAGLGSPRIIHARGARQAYKHAIDTFTRTIDAVEAGRCQKALDNFAVANEDFGQFFREHRYAVGVGAGGAMSAPRMKQALTNKRMDALRLLKKSCLR